MIARLWQWLTAPPRPRPPGPDMSKCICLKGYSPHCKIHNPGLR